MTKKIIRNNPRIIFEDIKRSNNQKTEYWSARDLGRALGYSEYRHFLPVVKRAKEACIKSGQSLNDHFENVLDMIELGKTATRRVSDIYLSRYAGYLIMQNADPSKNIVALGQTYFAIQTRRQEISDQLAQDEKRLYIRGEVTEGNKRLFSTAKKAGVTGFGSFNDAGYRGLYGKSLAEVEALKRIKKGELLDRAGATELAANLFRITQTDEKLKKDNIHGHREAVNTHNMVGGKVRQTIKQIGGVLPEDLPAEKHIKELKKELKKIGAKEQGKIQETSKHKPISRLVIQLPRLAKAQDLRMLNTLLRNNPGNTQVLISLSHNTYPPKYLNLPYKVSVTNSLESKINNIFKNIK